MSDLAYLVRLADAPAEAWFDAMADAAIRRSVLRVAGRGLAILEVEFYLYRPDHPDEHTHRSPAQLGAPGRWYWHRSKAATLSFTLKGLDLTFGPPGEAGGMLIRAVADVTGMGGHVEGPSCTVNEILNAAGVGSVVDLMALDGYSDDAFARDGLLSLRARAHPEIWEVRVGPRIGLTGSKPYVKAAYRYRAAATRTKKDRAGIVAGRLLQSPKLALEALLNGRPKEAAPEEKGALEQGATPAELDAMVTALLDGFDAGAAAEANAAPNPRARCIHASDFPATCVRATPDESPVGLLRELTRKPLAEIRTNIPFQVLLEAHHGRRPPDPAALVRISEIFGAQPCDAKGCDVSLPLEPRPEFDFTALVDTRPPRLTPAQVLASIGAATPTAEPLEADDAPLMEEVD